MNAWKPSLLALSVALGAGITCPACGSGGADASSTVEQTAAVGAADLERVEFEVGGMTCGGCALATKAAIKRLDGVRAAEAGYEKGSGAGWARVDFDPERVSREQIAQAIMEVGYEPIAHRELVR